MIPPPLNMGCILPLSSQFRHRLRTARPHVRIHLFQIFPLTPNKFWCLISILLCEDYFSTGIPTEINSPCLPPPMVSRACLVASLNNFSRYIASRFIQRDFIIRTKAVVWHHCCIVARSYITITFKTNTNRIKLIYFLPLFNFIFFTQHKIFYYH